MRSTPLAIWAHRLPPPAIAAAARADALLSHPSQPCQDANAAYVLACAWLVARPGDGEGALAAAEGWAEQHACQEVRSWLAAARDDGAMAGYDARPAMGWLRHALQLAFYHLRRRSAFQPGLRHTLLCGGDTGGRGLRSACGAAALPSSALRRLAGRHARARPPDCAAGGPPACPASTLSHPCASHFSSLSCSSSCSLPPPPAADTNAAIVCGLLGALHGAAAIPEGLSLTVEAYRWGPSGGGGHQRPEKLQGSQLRPLATRLFQQAAADAEQRGGQAGV
jgi:hypothetical protein